MAAEDSRLGERVPAAMRIKLKYPDVDTFIQRYSVNISRGGIFIATRAPKPVGTVVRFEFQLATSLPVIRGEGQVIWVKPYDPEQPRRVHGMGVRFTRLDAESRQIIDRALQWKKEHEGEPQEPPREDAEGDVLETSGGVQMPEGRPRPSDPPREASRPPQALAPDDGEGGRAERDSGLYAQVQVLQSAASPPPAPPAAGAPEADEQSEIVAELYQNSQSQVVRAAHEIRKATAGTNYFPEDGELAELLKPLRMSKPSDGREAARLLREMLSGRR